ncbi:MAG TPA: hypothetical protein VJ603_03400 [Paucimonas sp.]|nr:hypothetical protein [Paucimonas sp.]HJW54672.1 hypothetical protein [Burkholderiaceae bacterium]
MGRQWSKIKKAFEERLAPELKGRTVIHVTAYDSGGRGWIQFDGQEIVTTEAPGFLYSISGHRVYNELLNGQTIELGRACGELLDLSVEEARASRNPYIRGLFSLEKRCGRRTLSAIREYEQEPFAILLMSLRAYSLGISVEAYFHDCCGQQLIPAEWLTCR